MRHFGMMIALGVTLLIGAFSQAAPKGNMVCLFTQKDFKGAHFCFRPGQKPADLTAFALSDGTTTDGQFASIAVVGQATGIIYDAQNYQSAEAPMTVTQNIPDLAQVWKAAIFSIVVQ